MSQKFELKAAMREGTGTQVAKKLRREGVVPGVIYGGGQRTYPVQVPQKEITDLLKSALSENVLVNLQIDGAKEKNKLVLIQAVQHEVLSGNVSHIDFQSVKEDVDIRAVVPVHLHGEPAGVKEGGHLEHQVHNIEVRCLPKHLPEILDFDVSHLNLNEALHVGDVKLPEGVSAALGDQVVIAIVAETRLAKADAAGEGEAEGGGEEEAAAS